MAFPKTDQTVESPLEIATSKFLSFVGDDVLLDIFYRLPHYQSVIQCSIVCKRWFSVINSHSDEFFEHYNHKRSSSNDKSSNYIPSCTLLLYLIKINGPLYLQCVDKSNTGHSTSSPNFLNFFPWSDHVVIRASFGEFFLVSRKCNPRAFYLCNPLIKKWIVLPEAPKDRLRRGMVLDDNNSFRVVLMDIIPNEFHDVYQVTLFCSETGKWNESITYSRRALRSESEHVLNFTHGYVDQYQGVCTKDGNLHWLRGERVIVFNPYMKLHWSIKLPNEFGRRGLQDISQRARLGTVRGRLRLSEFFRGGPQTFVLKIWELKNYREGWTLVHTIVAWEAYITQVLAFHPRKGDEIFAARNFDIGLYDIRKQQYKKLGEFPKIPEGMISISLAGFFTFMNPLCPKSLFSLPV